MMECCLNFLLQHFLFASFILLCLLVVILIVDCDLVLLFYSRFGKSPSSALRGKVVWITGASSGIGEELAYQLAQCGAKLVLSARRSNELHRVLKKCKEMSPEDSKNSHSVLPLDLLQFDTHSELVDSVIFQYGKVDILVNNGGRSQRALAMESSLEVERALMELNVLGTVSLTRAVLKHMTEKKDGMIVVVSSIAGKLGAPVSSGYSASKHALQGYFGALRIELADAGVDVQLVCPGPVVSNVSVNAFTAKVDELVEELPPEQPGRLSTKRCVQLMLVGMANRLRELWISPNPILLFTYLVQYFPNLSTMLGLIIGPKRVKAYKSDGVHNLDSGYLR